MKMTVDVPESMEEELYKRAREDVKSEITEEAILDYMSKHDAPSVRELLKSFNVYRRYHEILETGQPVNTLTYNDKLICMLYWMLYDELGR